MIVETVTAAIVEPSGSVIYPVTCPHCELAQRVRMDRPITVITAYSCVLCGLVGMFQAGTS